METRMKELNMRLYPSLKINFKPSDEELNEAYEFGLNFGKVLLGEKELPAEDKNTTTENNTPSDSKGGLRLWKCVICGEIIESETVPEYCPVCGAGSDAFIEVQREVSTYKIDKEETYVIIGNGAAGFYAASAIKQRNESAIIKIISNEPVHSYVRTQLSDLITEDPHLLIHRNHPHAQMLQVPDVLSFLPYSSHKVLSYVSVLPRYGLQPVPTLLHSGHT